MDIHLTKNAAKGIDKLLVEGSNVKSNKRLLHDALGKVDNGTAPHDKVLHDTNGLRSIRLNNPNAFRGLVYYDNERGNHVLVAALTHKEYDKVIHDPTAVQKLHDDVKQGHYERISFDENTKRFQPLYDQAVLTNMIGAQKELVAAEQSFDVRGLATENKNMFSRQPPAQTGQQNKFTRK